MTRNRKIRRWKRGGVGRTMAGPAPFPFPARVPVMAAVFRLLRDGKRPLTVRLDADAVVGRGSSAGLRIDSRKVSREHCRLTIEEDVVAVRDLGSRNGTAVDGEPVETGREVDVPVGALLSVGGVELRLIRCGEVTVNADAPPPAPRVVPRSPAPGDGRTAAKAEPAPAPPAPAAEPPIPAERESEEEPSRTDLAAPTDPDPAAPPADDAAAEDVPAAVGPPANDEEPAGDGERDEPAAAPVLDESGGDADDAVDPAALDFLGDDAEQTSDGASALKVLPGGDARDQSSFTGFGDPDDAVDSGLLDFLNKDDR